MRKPKDFRAFLFFWASQGISALGSTLSYFTITIWLAQVIYPEPDQQAALTWALAAFSFVVFIPRVVLSPFAGVWVDRWDRRKIMWVVDWLQMVLSLAIVLTLLSSQSQESVWLVFLLVGCMELMSIFHELTFQTSYSLLVPDKKLSKANTMMQTMWTLTASLAPIVAATILSFPSWFFGLSTLYGVIMVFAIAALIFFISGLTLFFLPIPSPKKKQAIQKNRQPFWIDLRFGISYLWKRSSFLWLLSLTFIAQVVYASELLFPIMVKHQLAEDWTNMGWTFPFAYGFLETAGFVGAIIAGVLISKWRGFKGSQIYAILFPLIVSGFMFILFGLSTWLWLSSLFFFVHMFSNVFHTSYDAAIWQRNVSPEVQGRVFGIKKFILSFAPPLGFAVSGFLGAKLETNLVLILLGSTLAFYTLIQVFNQKLIRRESREKA